MKSMLEKHGDKIFKNWDWIQRERAIPIVDITTAGDGYKDLPNNRYRPASDFCHHLSPWPKAWYERSNPKYDTKFGVFIMNCEVGQEKQIKQVLADEILLHLPDSQYQTFFESCPEEDTTSIRWMQIYLCYSSHANQSPVLTMIHTQYVNDCGKVLDNNAKTVISRDLVAQLKALPEWPTFRNDAESDNAAVVGAFWCNFLVPVLFAISLLHHKNITTRDAVKPDQVKKVIGRGGIVFKTICINPFRNKSEGKALNTVAYELQRSHIVRGHSVTYTADKPLFGKPWGVGTFWVPMHFRGNKKHGEVRKNYKVAM